MQVIQSSKKQQLLRYFSDTFLVQSSHAVLLNNY
jgi:hypothetical protein